MEVLLSFAPFIIIFIIGAAIIVPLALKPTIKMRNLERAVRDLGNNLNEGSVLKFIQIINDTGSIPNVPTLWDTLRAGYELVVSNERISKEMKQELRNVMLAHGINRLREVK